MQQLQPGASEVDYALITRLLQLIQSMPTVAEKPAAWPAAALTQLSLPDAEVAPEIEVEIYPDGARLEQAVYTAKVGRRVGS